MFLCKQSVYLYCKPKKNFLILDLEKFWPRVKSSKSGFLRLSVFILSGDTKKTPTIPYKFFSKIFLENSVFLLMLAISKATQLEEHNLYCWITLCVWPRLSVPLLKALAEWGDEHGDFAVAQDPRFGGPGVQPMWFRGVWSALAWRKRLGWHMFCLSCDGLVPHAFLQSVSQARVLGWVVYRMIDLLFPALLLPSSSISRWPRGHVWGWILWHMRILCNYVGALVMSWCVCWSALGMLN